MAGNQRIFCEVLSVRKELFWDRDKEKLSPEIVIERAINFGGFDFIEEVQEKYGMEIFKEVLLKSKNLSKKAVNYWCLVLGINPKDAAAFKKAFSIWTPFR
jgi:hypothetical protein